MIAPDRKKVLIVTYYFPPAGGASVQRTLRFIHALPKESWEPVILTVGNGDYPARDESLLASLPPGLKVYRTYIPEPYKLYRKITGRAEGEALDLSALAVSEGRKSPAEWLSTFIRDWFFVPDPRVGWLPFAVLKGRSIITRERIDLLYSTAPPNSTHLIAMLLKMSKEIKWVADFRDPWFKYLVPKRNAALPRRFDAWLCNQVLLHADRVLSVCDGVEKELKSTATFDFSAKSTVLTNGFIRERFAGKSYTGSAKFTIVYVGSLFVKYDFSNFISALERLFARDSVFRKRFELVFVGSVDQNIGEKFRKASFSSNIRFLGYQPHSKTVEIMTSATLLLLYIIDSPEGRNIPTSKLFEYLGARRPIFAIAPEDSDAGRIIRKTGAGVLVDDAKEPIGSTIAELFQQWQQDRLVTPAGDENAVNQFEMANLTAKLVDIWDKVLLEQPATNHGNPPQV